MKFIQHIIDAAFGLYTIQNPWTTHDVKTPIPVDPDTTEYAKIVFYHYREGCVFERSIWRFLDVTFPREKTVANILQKYTKLHDPDIEDLFIHMHTNAEFTVPVPVGKIYDLKKALRAEGFTLLNTSTNPYP